MRGGRGRGNRGRGGYNQPIRFIGGGTLNTENGNPYANQQYGGNQLGGYGGNQLGGYGGNLGGQYNYSAPINPAADINTGGVDFSDDAKPPGQGATTYPIDLGTGLGKSYSEPSQAAPSKPSPAPECKAVPDMPDLDLSGKNPISVVNELFMPAPSAWTFQELPSPSPDVRMKAYLCTFVHENEQYQGQANTKKLAKFNAAYQFLQVIGWHPGFKKPSVEAPDESMEEGVVAPTAVATNPQAHPMMRLNEYWPGVLQTHADPSIPFNTTISVPGSELAFSGTGKNKKEAKLAAATKFLLAIESGEVVPPPKRPKVVRAAKRSLDTEPLLKSSLHQVTEMFGETLNWEAEQVGEEFSVKLELEGKTYTAKGASEKASQQMIASEVISDIEAGVIKAPEGASAVMQSADEAPEPKRPKSEMTNPVAKVSKLYPDLPLHYSSVGPIHCPVFTASVEIENSSFSGQGRTKKAAKLAICEQIVAAINSFEITPPELRNDGEPIKSQLQEAFNIFGSLLVYQKPTIVGPSHKPTVTLTATIGTKEFTATANSTSDAKKNCCNLILEALAKGELERPENPMSHQTAMPNYEGELCRLAAEAKHEVKFETRTVHNPTLKIFVCDVTIDDKMYSGSGTNLKTAKRNACVVALSERYNIQKRDIVGAADAAEMADAEQGDLGGMNPQHLSTVVHKLVSERYDAVAANLSVSERPWKVLSGCAVTINDDADSAKIVALATGTKCIQGKNLSAEGLVLNDMHAEILVRRALKLYLLEQIELARCGNLESIVRVVEGLYELKPGVKFHLFISSPPCGDSRLFSVSDDNLRKQIAFETTKDGEAMDTSTNKPTDDLGFDIPGKASNQKKRGLLRVKLEEGEGTIPVTSDNITRLQTWDGTVGGERLQIMSCSDKVARSTVLGFQGALLSTLMKPVYYSSIIVGSLYKFPHLYRGLYGRFSGVKDKLTGGYVTKPPTILGVFSTLPKINKARTHAVINKGEVTEVVQTTVGKTSKTPDTPSSFCKRTLFIKYRDLYLSIIGQAAPQSYSEAKHNATLYQANKKILNTYTNASGLGTWNKVPQEMDQFSV